MTECFPVARSNFTFFILGYCNAPCDGIKIDDKNNVEAKEMRPQRGLRGRIIYTDASARAVSLLTLLRRSRPLSDHGKWATGTTKKLGN